MIGRQFIVLPILALAAMLTVKTAFIGAAVAQEKVDLELVIAADGSGSIDDEELALQRRGYAKAVTDPTLLSLMTGGLYGKTAILYVEWGAADSVHTIVDWTIIASKEDAENFAHRLQTAPRKAFGYNAISAAIDYAVIQFDVNGIDGLRRIIDVSGDGPNINARPVTMARDEAVAQGITINALVVKTRGGGFRGPGGMPLDEHYRQHVIGGIGAFVRIADKDTSFAEAVRNKMLLEVAQGIPQTAAGPMVENRTIID